MGTASNQILAFDYGEKRIGVAVGQIITASANPIQALAAKSGEPDWQLVQKLIDEWQPTLVVVGSPLNMDGTEQRLTKRAHKFANRLHGCLLYTSPSPRDRTRSRMPSSA